MNLPLWGTLEFLAGFAIPALAGWSWRDHKVSTALLLAANYFVFSVIYQILLQEQISGTVLPLAARIAPDLHLEMLGVMLISFLLGGLAHLVFLRFRAPVGPRRNTRPAGVTR